MKTSGAAEHMMAFNAFVGGDSHTTSSSEKGIC